MDGRKIVASRHPLYRKNAQEWERVRAGWEGGRSFARTVLRRHAGEEDADFARRLALVWCPAYARDAVDDVVTAVFRRHADWRLTTDAPALRRLLEDDVDGRGSTLGAWATLEALRIALVAGSVWLGAEAPAWPEAFRSEAERAGAAGAPFARALWPIEVLDWQEDAAGVAALLVLERVARSEAESLFGTGSEPEYVLWTRPEVVRFDREGRVLRRSENGLGRVPFHRVDFGLSLVADLVDLQADAVNIVGGLQAFDHDSNFQTLAVQAGPLGDFARASREDDSAATVMGPTRILVLPEGATAAYIGPNAANADFSLRRLEYLEKLASARARRNLAAGARSLFAPSGTAAAYERLSLEGAVATWLHVLVERGIVPVARDLARYLGSDPERVDVAPPRSFDLETREQPLAGLGTELAAAESLSGVSPAACRVARRMALSALREAADAAEWEEILREAAQCAPLPEDGPDAPARAPGEGDVSPEAGR